MAALLFFLPRGGRQADATPDLEEAAGEDADDVAQFWADMPADKLEIAIKAACVIQRGFRQRHYKLRLDYRNLTDRILFEHDLLKGLCRLVVQIIIFMLLVIAANRTSNSAEKPGLYRELAEALDLDSLHSIRSRENFVNEYLPAISARAKPFFPLGSSYFQTGNQGALELWKHRQTFTAPIVLDGIDVNIALPDFSFTAWVRISPQFVSGYVLRKRIGSSAESQALSCWGWFISAQAGQQFHFGAHDFSPFAVSASSRSDPSSALHSDLQTIVGPEVEHPLEAEVDVLLTVRVQQSNMSRSSGKSGRMSFFVNTEEKANVPLTRTITDCYNDLEGPLLGSEGLQLAQVRFYPFAIGRSQIEEIMRAGDILKDLVSGNSLASPFADKGENVKDVFECSDSAQFMQAANEQKISSEVLDLVASARDEAAATPAAASIAAAPHGAITVNASAKTDMRGRQYFSLLEGPAILARPTVLDDNNNMTGPRSLVGVPSFSGSGVTFSWWHRHNSEAECRMLDNSYCGTYLLYAKDMNGAFCWSLWLESNGIFYENKEKAFKYPRNFMSDEYTLTATKSWRHVSFVLDASDDSVKFYLDGREAWTGPWGGRVANADCPARKIAFGRQSPGWDYGLELGVYDLRMYVGTALSPAHVLALSSDSGVLSSTDTCTGAAGTDLADKLWRDAMGRSCEWYHFHRSYAPSMCHLKDPSTFCPVACSSKQPCLRPTTGASEFLLWDRIRMIVPSSQNGTVCVNDQMAGLGGAGFAKDIKGVRALCDEWIAQGGGGGSKKDWMADFEQRTGKRIDFYNLTSVCDEIEQAIDEHCSFDVETVKKFTSAAIENGGDFTIAFWMRPVGPSSLSANQFKPSLVFYSSLFPPTHNVVLGGFTLNPNGEARVHTACLGASGDRIFENIQISEPSRDGWTFFALIRRNKTLPFQNRVVTDAAFNSENVLPPLCLYNQTALFNAIEVNYPMFISPILMVSEALPIGTLQRRYYASSNDMKKRRGPLVSTQERKQISVPVEQQDFVYRSSLVAPPMIFQTRSDPSNCSISYSREWISQQMSEVENVKCAAPFSCSASEAHIECSSSRSDGQENKTFFGLQKGQYKGDWGYSDFLNSLTDHVALYRGSTLESTSAFIDKHTSALKVLLAFYCPSVGVTSVLEIAADFKDPGGVSVKYDIQFFDIVEGRKMLDYVLVQAFACVLGLMLVLVMYWGVLESRKYEDDINWTMIGMYATDAIIGVAIPCGFIVGASTKTSSASETRHAVNGWANIGWDDDTVPLQEKKDNFFKGVQLLTDVINVNNFSDRIIFAVMLLNMVRLIQATNLHPRLALMTGTMGYAGEALAHAIAVAVVVFFGFACIGVWRFGHKREEFQTIYQAMATELSIMFSSDAPDAWQEDGEYMLFIFLYLFFMFILVLNFLLAIIVESYVQVRKDIEDCKIEQNFWEDAYATMYVHLIQRTRGWPSQAKLGHRLAELKAKNSIGYDELMALGLFKSQAAVVTFLNHYNDRYGDKASDSSAFLKPEIISRYGKRPQTSEEKVAFMVERRIANLLGIKPVSLQDMAHTKSKKSLETEAATRPFPFDRESLRMLPRMQAQYSTNGVKRSGERKNDGDMDAHVSFEAADVGVDARGGQGCKSSGGIDNNNASHFTYTDSSRDDALNMANEALWSEDIKDARHENAMANPTLPGSADDALSDLLEDAEKTKGAVDRSETVHDHHRA